MENKTIMTIFLFMVWVGSMMQQESDSCLERMSCFQAICWANGKLTISPFLEREKGVDPYFSIFSLLVVKWFILMLLSPGQASKHALERAWIFDHILLVGILFLVDVISPKDMTRWLKIKKKGKNRSKGKLSYKF